MFGDSQYTIEGKISSRSLQTKERRENKTQANMWVKILILTIVILLLTKTQATINYNQTEISIPMTMEELPSFNIIQYLWMHSPPPLFPYECLTFVVREPTRLEVNLYKTLCGKGPEIRYRVSSGIGFIYLGEENGVYYIMIFCQLYRFELRRVQDYVLWIVPDAGIKELTRNETVLTMEDLSHFANSIDAAKGDEDIGHTICCKK